MTFCSPRISFAAILTEMQENSAPVNAAFTSNDEPALDELTNDPIFARLLESDGLSFSHVEDVISSYRLFKSAA